jgi:hypothetical protein
MDKSIITGLFIGLIAVFKANKRFYGRILKDPATNDYPFPLLLQYSSNLLCFIFALRLGASAGEKNRPPRRKDAKLYKDKINVNPVLISV